VDEENRIIAYASVAIYKDRVPLTGAITDDEGKFSLRINQSKDDYQLVIEFIGYTKYTQPITPEHNHINLGTIVLKEDRIMLEGASVSAKEVAQKSNVEHTTINASANIAASKGTAIDILRSASSVSIADNEISIRGNSNILVLMDGVPTTATDLTTIPAGNIKSIEVITNPDASHDASGTGGIINIISKKTTVEGLSGIIAANYGFNHFATANAAISYNKPKASYRFSYNTKYEDDVVNTILQRKINTDGYEIAQRMQATRYVYNNNIGLGADFRLNPRNRLSIDAKCIIPRLNVRQDLRNTIIEDNISS
jgi:outer membrane receptor for ferrienterochelin and colicin